MAGSLFLHAVYDPARACGRAVQDIEYVCEFLSLATNLIQSNLLRHGCDKGIETPSGNPRRSPRQTGSRYLLFRPLPLFRCYHLEHLAEEGVKMKQRRRRVVSGTARVLCPGAP